MEQDVPLSKTGGSQDSELDLDNVTSHSKARENPVKDEGYDTEMKGACGDVILAAGNISQKQVPEETESKEAEISEGSELSRGKNNARNDDIDLSSGFSDQPATPELSLAREEKLNGTKPSDAEQLTVSCDQSVIQVTGLPKGIPEDFVRSFFESSRSSGGGETESIELKNNLGIAFITYKDPKTTQGVLNKGKLTFRGHDLSVTLYDPLPSSDVDQSRTVVVHGLTQEVDINVLIDLFENQRMSGGGPVETLDLKLGLELAYVTFADKEDADRLVSRGSLSFAGMNLTTAPLQQGDTPVACEDSAPSESKTSETNNKGDPEIKSEKEGSQKNEDTLVDLHDMSHLMQETARVLSKVTEDLPSVLEVSPESLRQLQDMGFSKSQASLALHKADNKLDRALDSLLHQDASVTDGEIVQLMSALPKGLGDMNNLLGALKNLAEDVDNNTLVTDNNDSQSKDLYKAAIRGNLDKVQKLLKSGVKPDSYRDPNNYNYTPLQASAFNGDLPIVKELLQAGADLTLGDKGGKTPLILASERGHIEVIKELLQAGSDINARSKLGSTALYQAASNGYDDCTEVLLSVGSEVDARHYMDSSTALHEACGRGHYLVVKKLVECGADINATHIQGNTPMFNAAGKGHALIVEMLLNYEAQHSTKREDQSTPLHVACQEGHFGTVEVLLKAGISCNIHNNKGVTPLISAAGGGHANVVHLLLSYGADPNRRRLDGVAPINVAAQKGSPSVVEVLLQHGADPRKPVFVRRGALHEAAMHGHESIVKMLLDYNQHKLVKDEDWETPIVLATQEIYAETRVNPDEQGEDNETPLQLAAQEGYEGIVDMLLEAGASVTAQGKGGSTALHLAAAGGHVGVIKKLLAANSDVMAVCYDGGLPLYLASQYGHSDDTVKLLIEAGADINAKRSSDGSTAIHIASQEGFFSVVDALLKAGADPNVKRHTGGTPLHSSVANSQVDIACRLIGAGADLTITDISRDTPLHDAAHLGKSDWVKVILQLVPQAKKCLHMKGGNDMTPRKRAKAKGHIELAEFLKSKENEEIKLNLGAMLYEAVQKKDRTLLRRILYLGQDPDAYTEFNTTTALHLASGCGDTESLRILLEGGASVKKKDLGGATPLHYAASNGQMEAIKVLLEYGGKECLDMCVGNGVSPYHMAREAGHQAVAELLYNYGKVLYEAVVEGSLEKVDRLLKGGIHPDKHNGNEKPLQCAISTGREDIVKILLENGASPTKLDVMNVSPLHKAVTRGSLSITELLLQYCDPYLLGAALAHKVKDRTPKELAVEENKTEIAQLLATVPVPVMENGISLGGNIITQETEDERCMPQYPVQISPDIKKVKLEECAVKDFSSSKKKLDMGKNWYPMTHNPRGFAIIYNTLKSNVPKTKERKGSLHDLAMMKHLFEELQFKCETYQDCSGMELKDLLNQVTKQDDLQHHDCFVLVLMSHGKTETDKQSPNFGQGLFLVQDTYVNITELIQIVQNSTKLLSKPKLILIQCCRGDRQEEGVQINPDDDSDSNIDQEAIIKVPSMADTLVLYSTAEGYKAFRKDDEGSVFMKAVHQVFLQYARVEDVLSLATRIIDRVADNRIVYEGKECYQCPEMKSTLRKKMHLFPTE